MVIERFVETRSAFEWGLVCHALSGAMRELLEDWRLLVTQLEHQHITGRLNLPVIKPLGGNTACFGAILSPLGSVLKSCLSRSRSGTTARSR